MKPLFCLSAALLMACGTTTYQVNQFHQDRKAKSSQFKGKKVFIAPLLLEATSVGNSSPSVDSGKQALHINKDSLANVYNAGLAGRFQRVFGNVTVVPAPDFARYNAVLTSDKLEETIHFYGKSKVEYYFKHPKPEVLDSLGVQADLIVYLTSLTVSIKDVTSAQMEGGGGGSWGQPTMTFVGGKPVMSSPMIPGGGGSYQEVRAPRLTAFAKFIVWDYSSRSAVSFGQFQIESGVDRDDIQGHWDDITRAVTNRITENTAKLR
jgi:hypothetical protein